MSHALAVFRFSRWFKEMQWEGFLFIFYPSVFLIILVILVFVCVSFSLKHKKLNFVGPLRFLRLTCEMLKSILFIPILGRG